MDVNYINFGGLLMLDPEPKDMYRCQKNPSFNLKCPSPVEETVGKSDGEHHHLL